MAEPEYIQQALFFETEETAIEELLDASSLNTILDMLAVIESLEELNLLESLSEAQQRQVWQALPESVHAHLEQLQQAQVNTQPASQPENDTTTLQVGDWVVLKAEPRLSAKEMIALWVVLEIQGEQVRVKAKGLGIRQYPIAWMLRYPKPLL
jgi:hypothetical protein